MKSPDRLLRTRRSRRAASTRPAPIAKDAHSRELTVGRRANRRTKKCFCGLPALVHTASCNQRAYSVAARPTPPAPAWTSTQSNARGRARRPTAWTVLQVVGNVLAFSGDSDGANRAKSRQSVRAMEASAAGAWPTASPPTAR
eukprot:scaffold327766_cov99-Tisochrysis_lutea.AAC.1